MPHGCAPTQFNKRHIQDPKHVVSHSDVQRTGSDPLGFVTSTVNLLVTSCWSDVRNCGKMLIFACRGLPRTSCAGFIHFGARRCSKTCILKCGMARRCSETHILLLLDEPSRRIRWVDGTKLWRNANCLWKLSEASRETFVLEVLFYEIWRKPRTKS